MPRIPPLPALLAGLCLLIAASRAHAQDPAQTVRRGERAVQDDSAAAVTTRWRDALARDSADLDAGLGLATVARQSYEFERAELLLNQVLASDSAGRWGLYARLGLYRVANATGDARRADSLLRGAVAQARRLHDRAAEVDALIGFTNTRSSDPVALEATMDTIGGLLPPGDGADRAEYLCRSGLYRGVRGEPDASDYVLRGTAMAERVGERQLVGHCLEAEGLLESLRNHNDSALATMDRALALLRATHEHAGIARVESRRSDILQGVGRLGEASVALGQVLSHATVSRNRQRLANAYGGLGMLALRVGDLTTAAERFRHAAALNDSLGLGEAKLIAMENEGEVLAASGDLDGARLAFQRAVDEGTRSDDFERVLLGTLNEKVKGKEKLRELYERPQLPRSGDAAGPPPADQINTYELRHLIHPPVVRVADDGRTATVAAVYSLVASSGDGAAFRRGEHEGGYIFGMRREPDGRWRFESMIVISENARNPLFSVA